MLLENITAILISERKIEEGARMRRMVLENTIEVVDDEVKSGKDAIRIAGTVTCGIDK